MKDIYIESNHGLVRKRNEDDVNVFRKDNTILLALADGMGGHPSGHIASNMVLRCLKMAFESFETSLDKPHAKQWLENLFENVNEVINKESSRVDEYRGMGTTLVAALINPEYILIANVGDSRAYVATKGQKLVQITEDHTLVAELFRQGGISKEELLSHPNKNILLQAIGTEPEIQVDIFELDDQPEMVLLCSDGLTDMVSDDEVEEIIFASNLLEEIGKNLISAANANGGKDNITVALWHSGEVEV
jgi:Serine/threonine protein phosphatase